MFDIVDFIYMWGYCGVIQTGRNMHSLGRFVDDQWCFVIKVSDTHGHKKGLHPPFQIPLALLLEPLGQHLRCRFLEVGIMIGDKGHVSSLDGDAILLYMSDLPSNAGGGGVIGGSKQKI